MPAAVFMVLHISPDFNSMLPQILGRKGPLPAKHPEDGEPIWPGRMGSPSSGCLAGSGPLRPRICGNMLLKSGEICKTIKTAAGIAGGNDRTNYCIASTAPAEPPHTKM